MKLLRRVDRINSELEKLLPSIPVLPQKPVSQSIHSMSTKQNPIRPGAVQKHKSANLATTWLVYGQPVQGDCRLGTIQAPHVKAAFKRARSLWPSHADAICIMNAKVQKIENKILEREFEQDANAIAHREAAFAACVHHFGYSVKYVTIMPSTSLLRSPSDTYHNSLGYTVVNDLPKMDALMRPESRVAAEHYMISVVAGVLAAEPFRARQTLGVGGPGFSRLRALLEAHEPENVQQYFDHLSNQAKQILAGRAFHGVEAVVESLLVCGDMQGEDISEELKRTPAAPAFRPSIPPEDRRDVGHAFARRGPESPAGPSTPTNGSTSVAVSPAGVADYRRERKCAFAKRGASSSRGSSLPATSPNTRR